jgi:hypothetical protein
MTVKDTSQAAYEFIRDNKLLSRMRWRTYDLMWTRGEPMTKGEVNHALFVPNQAHPSYHRRVDELVDWKVARYTGRDRRCRITGYVVEEFELILGALPVKPEKKPKKFHPKSQKGKQALDELREVIKLAQRLTAQAKKPYKCTEALGELGKWLAEQTSTKRARQEWAENEQSPG